MTKPQPIPAEGGSYVVGKSGKLCRTAGTLGPLDPAHVANQPPAATPPAVKEG